MENHMSFVLQLSSCFQTKRKSLFTSLMRLLRRETYLFLLQCSPHTRKISEQTSKDPRDILHFWLKNLNQILTGLSSLMRSMLAFFTQPKWWIYSQRRRFEEWQQPLTITMEDRLNKTCIRNLDSNLLICSQQFLSLKLNFLRKTTWNFDLNWLLLLMQDSLSLC